MLTLPAARAGLTKAVVGGVMTRFEHIASRRSIFHAGH